MLTATSALARMLRDPQQLKKMRHISIQIMRCEHFCLPWLWNALPPVDLGTSLKEASI